jgi:hypothetical protein
LGADANELSWRFVPALMDDLRQYILLPNGTFVSTNVSCPTTNSIEVSLASQELEEQTKGRFWTHSRIECLVPERDFFMDAEEYFEPFGIRPTQYAGIFFKPLFPF